MGCDFVGFILLIVVVEVKTSLRLGLSAQIKGQVFIIGDYNTDNCYNTLIR